MSGGKPVNFTTGFHTYAVEWDKNPNTNANEIRYYVDGNKYFTVTQNSSMSDANFTTAKNIILNLAVGGDFGGDDTGDFGSPGPSRKVAVGARNGNPRADMDDEIPF